MSILELADYLLKEKCKRRIQVGRQNANENMADSRWRMKIAINFSRSHTKNI